MVAAPHHHRKARDGARGPDQGPGNRRMLRLGSELPDVRTVRGAWLDSRGVAPATGQDRGTSKSAQRRSDGVERRGDPHSPALGTGAAGIAGSCPPDAEAAVGQSQPIATSSINPYRPEPRRARARSVPERAVADTRSGHSSQVPLSPAEPGQSRPAEGPKRAR